MANGNGNKTCLILYNTWKKNPEPPEEEMDSLNEVRTEIAAVRTALRENGYNVRTLGIRNISARIVSQIEDLDPDFIFNLMEQLYDQSKMEMYIAGLFELIKIPYTGSPPFALGLALNKYKTKQVLRGAGISVPPSVVALPGEAPDLESLNAPYIVKPVREDGSAGITSTSVKKTAEEVLANVHLIHDEFHQPAIIQEYIAGREFNVYIIGNNPPRVLAVSEIDFSAMPEGEAHIISYDAKWVPGSPLFSGSKHICPANIDGPLQARLEKMALRTYKELGCRDYARVDIRMGEDRKLYILEVNTNPDIAPESGYGEAAKVAGLTYKDVIGEIAEYAYKRNSRKLTIEAAIRSVI